ncbi:phosphotransferase family protein [Sphingomonas profundi]|uniref:phosphotransferase family protein n=1 Tax=Alterirhizorhabdus profundi TaxID=2681549 RepID=UPI0012E87A33|nr:phosphotransferase family protein [Sphingomonas profundi]
MDFTPAHLARYLTHKLGEAVRVHDVERFSRGTSRQTWFVRISRPTSPAEDETLVFRADLAAGSIEPTSLAQEHFMYERLGHTAVPVAPVLFWEEDPAWTATPFYVRRKVEGSWNIPGFLDPDPTHDALRIAISQEHLRALAIVHEVDWRGLGFGDRLPVPRDEADCAHRYIDTVMDQFDQVRGNGMPVMLEVAEWLHDTAPVAPCIALCKGTNGFGEEVFREGRLVAMSDWEEASIGDPAADFAFMQYLAPELERDGRKIWGMEQAIAYYRSIGGATVSIEAVRFYGVLRAMRLIAMSEKAGGSVRDQPRLAEIRQAWTATEVGYICRRGLIAAMGLSDPPPAAALAELHETIEAPL